MLKREYKYLVPNEIIGQVRKELKHLIELDKYASIRPQKEYTVRSIYYDNKELDFYYEKLAGLKNRRKLRIRGYNEPGIKNIVFLEIKCKNESFINKYRSMLYYENLNDLLFTGDLQSYILKKGNGSIENANRFFFHLNRKRLKPVSLVVYDREAFFSKFDSNFRITFDKNLRYSSFPSIDDLYREDILKKAMKKYFVFEIKFYRGYSEHLHKIIRQFELVRLSVSKYQICVDAERIDGKAMNNKSSFYSVPVWREHNYCREAI